MDIYKQLDELLKEEAIECEQLIKEVIKEIKDLKKLLQQNKSSNNNNYYKFVNQLRKSLKADVKNKIYPEIIYKNKKYGIDFNGYIYDKTTTNTLKAHQAFEIYEFLYKNRKNLSKFIKK